MKKISYKETKKKLTDIWPNIDRVPTDRDSYVADLDWLMEQLNIIRPEFPEYKPKKFACEEFAMGSWVMLHWHRSELDEEIDRDANIHYGVIFGTQFKNAWGPHFNNFAITEQGLYIIDFDNMQHWEPTDADKVMWGFE